MCDFISWIERGDKIIFLTADNLAELGSFYNICPTGHEAIRKFYKFTGGEDKRNRNFWNGRLPKQIKEAWNQGKLDGMLKHLRNDDLEYILVNSPEEFSRWALAQRYSKDCDYEAIKKDSDWAKRLVGLTATKDYEAMIKDCEWVIRLFGMTAEQDYNDNSRPIIR